MEREKGSKKTGESLLRGVFGKLAPKKAQAAAPSNAPLAMLERLHTGERPDYCLYLRPDAGAPVDKTVPLSIDLEELLIQAFAPLQVIALEEHASEWGLPEESFLTLANRGRVLCVVPTAQARFNLRLRSIQKSGPLSRCIFVMPDNGTLGSADWSAIWPGVVEEAAKLNLEFSGYTPGGWLFRIDKTGKACTFRPIVNPNAEKVAKALESICEEMEQ